MAPAERQLVGQWRDEYPICAEPLCQLWRDRAGGATLKLGARSEVTGYVMHAPRQTVRGQNSIPLPFGGGEADVYLSETAFGLSWGLNF